MKAFTADSYFVLYPTNLKQPSPTAVHKHRHQIMWNQNSMTMFNSVQLLYTLSFSEINILGALYKQMVGMTSSSVNQICTSEIRIRSRADLLWMYWATLQNLCL
jgi:hypothetical protein